MSVRRITIRNAPFAVKSIEQDFDLRTIVCKSVALRALAKRFALRDDEAIAFTNKAVNRFRLIWQHKGLLFVVIPEVNLENVHQTFLNIGKVVTLMTPEGSAVRKNVVNLTNIKQAGIAAGKMAARG